MLERTQTVDQLLEELQTLRHRLSRMEEAQAERDRAEEAMRQAEEKYRSIFENATEGIFQSTTDGRYLSANPALARIYGYESPAELLSAVTDIGRQLYVEPQRRDEFIRLLHEHGSVSHFEVRIRRKDGSVVWTSRSARAVRDAAGRVLYFEGTVRDITAQKQAEEALSRANETLRALIQASPVAILTIDPAGIVRSWNAAAERMFGWSEAEILGHPSPLAPHERRTESQALRRRVLQGESFTGIETRRQRKDGECIDVSISAAPLYDHAGAVNGIVAVMADITERKRAEAALRESEERFRQMAENIREVFWMTDPQMTRYHYVSPAYESIWGRSRDRLFAEPFAWLDAIDPEDRERVITAYDRAPRGEYDVEYRIIRPDGAVRWIRDRAFPIHDSTGKVIRLAGIAEDITERKRLEDQLRQASKMEAIGRLAGGVAHDFNNLLTAIIGYSDMLLQGGATGLAVEEGLREIKKAGERAAALVQQLLAFGRRQMLAPKVLSLNTVVTDVEKMLRRLIGEDIELVVRLDPGLRQVLADPGQMEQVLLNLAVNARDALPTGGRLVIETANTELDEAYAWSQADVPPGAYALLRVSDNGCGMDEEVRAHLFEPFFTTKEVGKGTGLGLATVYGIVKQSGGHIEVVSSPGQGTTFSIYLPQILEGPKKQKREAGPSRMPTGTETILLVEDEEFVRSLTSTILRRNGYTVLESHRSLDALQLGEQYDGPIHLLLTDVVMPSLNGRELYHRLARQRPNLKVIYISGYPGDAIGHLGGGQEGTPFLQKPFLPDVLAHKVREVLDR